MTNILIVGIGGVGGYFGGLLSRTFENNPDISIQFMARGQNLEAIKSNGLHIKSSKEDFTTFPTCISSNPADFGKVDYIILCTKSYDIEETIALLAPVVAEQTTFVPLLNGVDSSDRIRSMFPNHLVTDGCANIIARLISPGVIENFSDFKTIRFGVQHIDDPRLNKLQQLFEKAGIQAKLTKNIWKDIWEKFIFISTAATATSYYNKNFGQIRDNAAYLTDLNNLLDEICLLAQSKEIELSENVKEKTLQMFGNAPSDSTASMHSDFLSNKGKTELESLTGYVIKEGNQFHLALPTYQKMYKYLSDSQLLHNYKGYH